MDNQAKENNIWISEGILFIENMEAIEWEEQYKKKCQKMLDEKNK